MCVLDNSCQRPVSYLLLRANHLSRFVLPGQPHPGDRRNVVRRLSETGAGRAAGRGGADAGN